MITIKSAQQIEKMRASARITRDALLLLEKHVKPGVTTAQLNKIAHDFILSKGAKPNFLNYGGFPASICTSVNDVVVHGIPEKGRVLKEGDIISIDMGAVLDGFHSDAARTFPVGKISPEAQRIIDVTKESFFKGIEKFKDGNRLGDIGHAIDSFVVENGFSTVKRYIGHGIGRDVHEAPDVPNFGTAGRGPRLCRGMTIAIEPMINVGSGDVKEMSDGWTVLTLDGKLSAHYENTVALTDEGPIILTDPN
jgi:methionyl aminopeptidase